MIDFELEVPDDGGEAELEVDQGEPHSDADPRTLAERDVGHVRTLFDILGREAIRIASCRIFPEAIVILNAHVRNPHELTLLDHVLRAGNLVVGKVISSSTEKILYKFPPPIISIFFKN